MKELFKKIKENEKEKSSPLKLKLDSQRNEKLNFMMPKDDLKALSGLDPNWQTIIGLFYSSNREKVINYFEQNKNINVTEIVDKKLYTRKP